MNFTDNGYYNEEDLYLEELQAEADAMEGEIIAKKLQIEMYQRFLVRSEYGEIGKKYKTVIARLVREIKVLESELKYQTQMIIG